MELGSGWPMPIGLGQLRVKLWARTYFRLGLGLIIEPIYILGPSSISGMIPSSTKGSSLSPIKMRNGQRDELQVSPSLRPAHSETCTAAPYLVREGSCYHYRGGIGKVGESVHWMLEDGGSDGVSLSMDAKRWCT